MNGVNLNSPDLKLVRTSEQAPARASASPLAESRSAPAQPASVTNEASGNRVVVGQEPSKAERLEARNEEQRKRLDGAVSQLNDFVQNVQRDLQFEVDNEKGQTIVRVVDQSTQEVIRQIPDEVALRLAEKLQQDEPLTLFNIKV
ncbi:MAG: flagellar protein FlaG [Marinobacter sp.]|uniref:flagellar protein FlaG n=1 Tax=Marinobacter sp. TaxID=50741 RepID=UPI00299EE7B6|nr:flagellar protein FlaG [Marinobacter sp.]MDX1635893.1 flagellar protein FlaG [Marinobacter sp.]